MEGIDQFISALGSAGPFPGGGSAAALAGALAAALGEMMAGLTEGREKFASVQSQVRRIHAKMTDFRGELQALVREDVIAFRSLMDAMRMPRETEEQTLARTNAIDKSVRDATETPLRTARAAVEVLEGLKILIEIGNPNAKSDAAVGAQLAYAALKGGQYNVLANIRGMGDLSYAGTAALKSQISLTGVTKSFNKSTIRYQAANKALSDSRQDKSRPRISRIFTNQCMGGSQFRQRTRKEIYDAVH